MVMERIFKLHSGKMCPLWRGYLSLKPGKMCPLWRDYLSLQSENVSVMGKYVRYGEII